MNKAAKFLVDNNVFQIILACMIWATICYLYIIQVEVPDALLGVGSLVIGYYFHSAAQTAMTVKAKVQNDRLSSG